ncbi:MAG: ribokinase [Arachnia sp.]
MHKDKNSGRVVVLGSASQDLYVEMERHPTTGETVMAGDIVQRFGGKGGNQAVAAAREGAETVFVGRLGDDDPGRTYRDRLVGHGVDVTRLVLEPHVPTGTALIMLNAEHDNMIVVAPGANHHVNDEQVAALHDLGPADVLLMPMELPLDVTISAIITAAGQGARVILNLAPYAALPQEVLDVCFLIIVNEKENELMVGDGLTAPEILVTLGTEGSRWGDLTVPARKVRAVDTTGAGDAYCGALAAALVTGADKKEAMVSATACSAATVQHMGAQPDPQQG